jgi:hypothetical protein
MQRGNASTKLILVLILPQQKNIHQAVREGASSKPIFLLSQSLFFYFLYAEEGRKLFATKIQEVVRSRALEIPFHIGGFVVSSKLGNEEPENLFAAFREHNLELAFFQLTTDNQAIIEAIQSWDTVVIILDSNVTSDTFTFEAKAIIYQKWKSGKLILVAVEAAILEQPIWPTSQPPLLDAILPFRVSYQPMALKTLLEKELTNEHETKSGIEISSGGGAIIFPDSRVDCLIYQVDKVTISRHSFTHTTILKGLR